MARASKLISHLPGRKSKKDPCSGAADHSRLFYEIPKPSLNSGSKANRLLGLPDIWYHQSTQEEEQCVGSMYSKQDTAGIMVSSVSMHPTRKRDENGHHLAEKQERKLLKQSAEALEAQPLSSPYRKLSMNASSNWDSSTDATSSRLQHSHSSSTLRSSGESLATVLSKPQPTLLSSHRNTTPPKGCYRTSSRPRLKNNSGVYTNPTMQSMDSLDGTACTQMKPNSLYLESSLLFPESYSSNGLLSSSHRRIDSPVVSSITPDGHQSTLSTRRNWFGLKVTKQKQSKSGDLETARLSSDVKHQLQLSSMIAAERPKDKVQNWFDALEEEDCLLPTRQVDYSENRQYQTPDPSGVARVTPAADLSEVVMERRNLMDHNRHLSTYARVASFQQGTTATQLERLPPRHRLQASEVRRTRISSTEQNLNSRQSRESIFWNTNLQKQSVLVLSLSEDDSENELTPTVDALRRRIRGGVDDFASSDVPLHTAQQVAYSRSGPIATEKARMISRPSPCADQAFVEDGNPPSVQNQSPEKSDFSESEHHGDLKLDTSRLDLKYEPSSADSHSRLPHPYGPLLQCKDADESQVTGEAGRMITVTEDEAHLLEAMRRKGSSKRPNAPDKYSIFPSRKSGNGIILGYNAEEPDPRTSVARTVMSNFPSPPSLASTKIYGHSFRASSTSSLSSKRVAASSSSLETFICITDRVIKTRLSPTVQFDPPLPSPSISIASIMSP